MIYPKFIKTTNTIGVTAPSDGTSNEFDLKKLKNSKKKLEDEGFKLRITDNCYTSSLGRSSSSVIRARELENLFLDNDVASIIAYSGGDFLMEMLSVLRYDIIWNNPKWIQGYSDITGLLFTITTNLGIEAYYGNNFKAYQYNNFINDSNIFGGVIDAVCTEDDMKTLTAIIECKTSSKPHLWENNSVPIEYLLQGAEYVYLKNLDRIVFICAFLQDNDYNHPENFKPDENNTIFVVKKLKDIVVEVNGKLMSFQEVIDYCEEWWHKYIETGISPEFDEKKDKQYLDIIRTSSPAKDNDLDTLCNYAKELKKKISDIITTNGLDSLEKELKTIENAIKEKMIDNLQDGETKMAYKQYKLSGSISKKFDAKGFQQDHPKTYDKYLRETITYRLLENKGEED